MLKYICLLFFIEILATAQSNYIDQGHAKLSELVTELGTTIDQRVQEHLLNANTTKTNEKNERIDRFFQNKKYINTTKKAYIRLRFTNSFASKDPRTLNFHIRAQLPLRSLNEAFKLFIDNQSNNYLKDSTQEYTQQNAVAVGINFFATLKHAVESKYSIGIRSTELFAQAIYSKKYYSGAWKIEPQQLFEYTSKNIFSEETNIYFDHKYNTQELLRIGIHRSTEQKHAGMDYGSHITYYHSLSNRRGYSFGEYLHGNTQYKDGSSKYPGIYEYATAFNWREQIYRKWILYEIQPILSFHKKHDYKANYILQANIEFYFGGGY